LLYGIIPLVFFTIASRQFRKIRKLGKFVVVIGVFLATVLVSAILTIIGVLLPIHQDHHFKMPLRHAGCEWRFANYQLLTANDFTNCFQMLALA
jgi:hypothetical protein